ncbi:glucosaminidase domain-containing protein [Flavobacterium sp. GNP001]
MFKKIILLFFVILLGSCNSTKPIITTKKPVSNTKVTPTRMIKKNPVSTVTKTKPIPKKVTSTSTKKPEIETIVSTSKTVVTSDVIVMYVAKFKDIAMNNMKSYGIPASIILAQGILESGAGKGDLAFNANNHFGIKCHVGWTGDSVKHDDDASQECFRKYESPSESFRDHALFLTTRSRYAKLFQLPKGDYKAWAHGLRVAGYATDPKYPDKLISYIDRYQLHQYDNQVLDINYIPSKETVVLVQNNELNEAEYVVQKGDTLYSISKKFALKIEELKEKNKLSDNSLSIGQRLVVK